MGVCCSQNSDIQKNKSKTTFTKTTLSKFKKAYYSQLSNSSNLPQTSATSNQQQNITPEIYSFDKYGIQIKTNQSFSRPLKFIFNIYNFKCKMLPENTLYILYIIFDGKDFPMVFGKGNNPTFVFNQTFGKEISFEKLSKSFMEVYLYTYKSNLNDKRNIDLMTKSDILGEAQIFSSFKINLLTLAYAPEKHDLALIDPKRVRVQLGRISYCVSCKHIEDVDIKIKAFKININNLKYNEIALKLKLENKTLYRKKESEYLQNLTGEPNDNENSMIYVYPCNREEDLFLYNISESFALAKKNISKIINNNCNINDNNNKNNINNINNIKEKLNIHGKMSMIDLFNSDTTLDIFSVRLQKNIEPNQKKRKDSNFFMKKVELPEIAKMSYIKNIGNANSEFVYAYKLIGIISLNFNKILNDLEEKLWTISNRLFQAMSNKNGYLIKTLSGSKIMKFGIEEDLTNKVQSNKNLRDFNLDEFKYKTENFIIKVFENETLDVTEDIFWEGESIGTIDLTIEISNLPLIRQIRFGVMTETGFELSSIFLYDNSNLSDNLPEEILELNKLKEKFEPDIDYSILKKIKSCLEKSSVDNELYYGYSFNEDLYQAQAIIIDLGLGLFEFLDQIKFEYLHIAFDILKLIVIRSEFDLGTLSAKWFKPRRILLHQKNSNENLLHYTKSSIFNFDCDYDEIEYEFLDNILVSNNIIEKYLNFHEELLSFCLNNLNKGKNISKDSMEFTYFYLAFAFFQNPQFRNSFIKAIVNNIDLKDKKYLKFLNRITNSYSRKDSTSTNNFIIWDILFYKRLESSINFFLIKLNRKFSDNNDSNGIGNINAIKEQLMNIKCLTEISDQKCQNNDMNSFNKSNWYEKINKRDYIFYDLILQIFDYLNEIRNKYTTKSSNLINFKSPDKMLSFVGIEKIIKIIKYDLITKKAKDYPKQIKELIPKFYIDPREINNLIYIMFITTNVYDTLSIFNIFEILDYLFNKKYEYNNFIKEEIDLTVVKNAFVIIVGSENCLAIAKFIWFYYKNNSLINFNHMNDIIKYIISIFLKLFFHWSFQIREIFYFFIVFILGYKLKANLKSKNEKNKNRNCSGNSSNIPMSLDKENTFSDVFLKKKNNQKEEYFYVSDELHENMEIISQLQKIIKRENYQEAYMDNVINIKDEEILQKIPKESHGNIIECLRQYNNVVTKFGIWEKNIIEGNVTEDMVEYPHMEISIIKDDKIQYDTI